MEALLRSGILSPEDSVVRGLLIWKELHGDLSRRYHKHKVEIETFWRSFDAAQRTNCLTTSPLNTVDVDELQLGRHSIIPEWNLRDMEDSGPDFALNLFKDRATTSTYLGTVSRPDAFRWSRRPRYCFSHAKFREYTRLCRAGGLRVLYHGVLREGR